LLCTRPLAQYRRRFRQRTAKDAAQAKLVDRSSASIGGSLW
jgi:hypothetical protein